MARACSDLWITGSWDGEIKLWKLDSKLKSFSLAGTIPALGVVNSLQFVSPSKEFFSHAPWTACEDSASPTPTNVKGKSDASTVLLIAGVGQEMRAGRWVCQKGEGTINGAVVFALHPRT